MSSVSVLGRGLGALLPTPGPTAGGPAAEGRPLYVSLGSIIPRRDQPRQTFDDETLRQLAISIQEQGILQPLVVSERPDGSYDLIAGERRLRASRLAGLSTVPVVLRTAGQAEAFELALIENIQRQDLNPIEEAEAYRRLVEEHGYTQDALARRVGKDRTTVANALRLLRLRPDLRDRVIAGLMTAGHARALLGTNDPEFQDILAARIETEGLSVRAVERLVSARRESRPAAPARKKVDPFRTERATFVSRLESRFGREVKIRPKGDGGTLTLTYESLADLRDLVASLENKA